LDIKEAKAWMNGKDHHRSPQDVSTETEDEWTGETWDDAQTTRYLEANPSASLILLDSYIVDVSRYLKEHVSYTLWLLNMDLT
jgi:hypothetical protein